MPLFLNRVILLLRRGFALAYSFNRVLLIYLQEKGATLNLISSLFKKWGLLE
jgi:hypothetical protein